MAEWIFCRNAASRRADGSDHALAELERKYILLGYVWLATFLVGALFSGIVALAMVATGLCAKFSHEYSYGEKIENLKTLYNPSLGLLYCLDGR